MTVLFISDLHLNSEQPAVTTLFLNFLSTQAVHAQQLYILGDLFEIWLGDDAVDEEQARIVTALSAVSNRGVDIAIMHGNRDFLIGKNFAEQTGCRLIVDPYELELAGQHTLLMHGDTLCTDDIAYQAFRARVRDMAFRKEFLSLTVAQRIEQARQYREMSQSEVQSKTADIMDVNDQAVMATMSQHRVSRLIHGHTHRPAIHDLTIDNGPAQRIVLGDWSARQGNMLVCDDRQCRYRTFTAEDLRQRLF